MNRLKTFLFKNTSDKQMLMKNTLWLFAGEIGGRLFKLAIVVFATRELGVEGWGLFSYALAFVSFFYILGDLGINTFTTRELSKGGQDTYRHIATSFILKLSLLIVLFILSLVLGPHIGNISLGMPVLTIISILFLSDCTREFGLSIIRSLGHMEQEAFSKVLMNCIITVVGIVLILKNATPLSLAIAYATGSVVATVFVIWSIRPELKKLTWSISKESMRIIYAFSWPVIIISSFSFVFNIDSVMLGQIKSAAEVGLYAAAQRIVQFIAIIPAFIAMSAFPLLSKNEFNSEKMATMLEKLLTTVFMIGIPVVVGGFLLRTPIMSLIFGASYLAGGLTFGILILSLLASFPNVILTNVIFSKNLQRTFIAATVIGVLVNIALNIILIPRYGPVGAALSVVTTQIFIMAINWWKLKKILPFSVIPKLAIIIVSAIAMAIAVFVLHHVGTPLVITILLAILVYGSSLYILREPSLAELSSLVTTR